MVSAALQRSGRGTYSQLIPAVRNSSRIQGASDSSDNTPRKLGIIAGTFADGSLSFFVVPDPSSLERPAEHPENEPMYGESLLRLPVKTNLTR